MARGVEDEALHLTVLVPLTLHCAQDPEHVRAGAPVGLPPAGGMVKHRVKIGRVGGLSLNEIVSHVIHYS